MEFPHRTLYGLSLLALALALPVDNLFAGGEEAGTSATLDAFILPEYHKSDNRLQCILYGEKAVNQGAFITLTNPLLDIVQDNLRNINDVVGYQGLKLYAIDSPSASIKSFWKGKGHSRAIVGAPTAVYDRTTKMLRGDERVLFRSPGMDIDGVGFDANDETRFIHIRSKVKVVVRPEMRQFVEAPKSSKDVEAKPGKDSPK